MIHVKRSILGIRFMIMYLQILLFTLLGGFLEFGVQQVSGVFIYTAGEVEAVNGTDVKLKCTFGSFYPVSLDSVSVYWFFTPKGRKREQSVFYYNKKPYPPTRGRFRKRVEWSGDVLKKDATISLKRVTPKHGGTYACKVHNLPDVTGREGKVVLKVVNKTSSIDPFDMFTALLDMI